MRIALLQGVGFGRGKSKARANTPQAKRFKAAILSCRSEKYDGTLGGAQKALGKCVAGKYGKRKSSKRGKRK